MFKKFNIALSVMLAFSMLTLGGCSSSSNSTTNTSSTTNDSNVTTNTDNINLTLWHYYNNNTKDSFDVILNDFNTGVGAQNNITVEAYSYSSVSDLSTALVSAANKEVGMEQMPNIFSAYTDTTLLLDNLGVVAGMDDYFTADEIALFQQDFLNEGRFDSEGNLKIIPVAKSTEILFINDTDFEVFANETGVSLSQLETWEGLAEVAEIYYNWTDAKTEEEHDGSALFGVDSEANFMLVAAKQMGEEIYNYDDGLSFGLSEKAAKKIWENLVTPYIKGYFKAYGSYRSDDVKSGDLLMYTGSTSSVYYFPTKVELGRETIYDIEGTAMPYPYFEGNEKVAVQQGAGMAVSKSDTATEEAAVFFLKWFTSYENNTAFAVSTGYIPVQNESLSLDRVLTEMESSSDGEIANIVIESTNIIYNDLLPNYTFYSNKPFDGSYDTRTATSSSIKNIIADSEASVEDMVANGTSREDAIALATSDDAFNTWYNSLKTDVNDILGVN